MNYFDTKQKVIQTATLIRLRGLPFDNKILAKAGIYPIKYNYVNYDKDLQEMLPKSDLPKLENGEYVINFKVQDISDDMLANKVSEVADRQAKKVRAYADQALYELQGGYSESEKHTFATQANEASQYMADNNAPTPTIDTLAKIRGIDRVSLINKCYNKSQSYNKALQHIVGTQQKYADDITNIVNSNITNRNKIIKLRELSFEYSLPETQQPKPKSLSELMNGN